MSYWGDNTYAEVCREGRGMPLPPLRQERNEGKMSAAQSAATDKDKVTVYHVTPARNADSIHKAGISPEFSEGKEKVSWWVKEENLLWAIAHTSARHDVSVSHLIVYRVILFRQQLKATRWPGVYKTWFVIKTNYSYRAERFVEPPEFIIQGVDSASPKD
jgi:hypothetical protein